MRDLALWIKTIPYYNYKNKKRFAGLLPATVIYFIKLMVIQHTQIQFRQLHFYAFHGVLPQEKVVGNHYLVDLDIHTDFTKACQSDQLEDTINYAAIYHCLDKVMQAPSQLLEHVIYEMASHLFESFSTIHKVRIGLYKSNPPMGGQAKRVGVEAVFTRD